MPEIAISVEGLGKATTNITYFDDTVVQYRGIPYGSISKRFRQSRLVDSWPNNFLDANNYGPIAPFPPAAANFNFNGISLPPDGPALKSDEFGCLNLNITKPIEGTHLPVAVFIHGGANCLGSGSSAQYNGGRLVHLSMKINRPIIFVTINYRLGAFGFLASQDLLQDNREAGDEGVGNYGIRDQMTALEWVQRYIHSFGGDSNNVTVMGESAGGSDIHIQLLSKWAQGKKLFSQAVLMSGNAVLTTRPLAHQDKIYREFLAHCQIPETLPVLDRVEQLRQISTEDLLEAYAATGQIVPNWQGTEDGFLLEKLPSFSTLSSQTYGSKVQRIIIGDCDREGVLWGQKIAQGGWTPEKISSLLKKYLTAEAVSRLVSDYKLEHFSSTEAVLKLEPLLTDVEFCQGIYEIAKTWRGSQAFYYHMRYINPFDGPFKGTAHHAVDLLFVFQTFNDLLPEDYRVAAEEMGEHWIRFFNGEDPWPSFDSSKSAMCYGPEKNSLLSKEEDQLGRYQRWDFIEILQDTISAASREIRQETIHL